MQSFHYILIGIIFSISENTFAQVELGHVEKGCPVGSYRHKQMCYAISDDDEIVYDKAKTLCKESGGSLAIIRDYETHVFLHRLRMRNFLHCYWFGLHDKQGEGDWRFEDGTKPVQYSNWDVGEPNNNAGVQDCASLLMHKNLSWDDEYCYMNFLYVCEFPENKCTSKSNILGKTCYEPSHEFAPYDQANKKCKARGGQLALIKSKEIDTFIRGLIYNDTFWLTMTENEIKDVFAGLALKFTWIKGSWLDMQYKNNEWVHNDNTRVNFTRWSTDNPGSSYKSCATLGERMNPYTCGIHYSHGKTDYSHEHIEECYRFAQSWNSAQCSDKNSYICQYPATEIPQSGPIPTTAFPTTAEQNPSYFPTSAATPKSGDPEPTEGLNTDNQTNTAPTNEGLSNNGKQKHEALESDENMQGGIHLGVAPFILIIISCFLIGIILTVVTYGAYLKKRNGGVVNYEGRRSLIEISESNQ